MLTRRNLKKNKETFRVHSIDNQYLNVPSPEYANNSHTCPRFNRLSLDFTLHASITSLAGSNNSISASEGSKDGEKLKLPPLNVGTITPRSVSPDLPDSPKSWRADRSPLPVRKLHAENERSWGSCPSLIDEGMMKHFIKEGGKDSFRLSMHNYESKPRVCCYADIDKSCESVFFNTASTEELDQARNILTHISSGGRRTELTSDKAENLNVSCVNSTSEEPQIVVDLERDETCYENEAIYDEEDLVDAKEKCMCWLKGLEASRNSGDEINSAPGMYHKLNTRLSSSMEAIMDY